MWNFQSAEEREKILKEGNKKEYQPKITKLRDDEGDCDCCDEYGPCLEWWLEDECYQHLCYNCIEKVHLSFPIQDGKK